MMSLDMGIVFVVVIVMLICLLREVGRPDFIMFCALAMLMLLGVITPADALRGFSNEGMLTVALLFIVAGAVQQSGILNQTVHKVLGQGQEPKKGLLKMMFSVSGLSAFLNNTPIVVLLTPIVRKWCKENNIAPSKFLIPLSYTAIFGGTMTLIGTSTNLLVHGLMLEHEMSGFTMFQLAIVGLPVTLVGIFYLATIGYKRLPSRKTLDESLQESSREYLAEVVVEPDCPLTHQTISDAGLRNLKGLYLIEIVRNGERIYPVSSEHVLKVHDRLIFTGMISTIVELQNIKGLRLETGSSLGLEDLKNGQASLIEAVVSHQSSLIHQTIKESKFRSRFDAGVVAVHRHSERIKNKVGEIVLKPGDTLLLLAGKDFMKRSSAGNDFYLISTVEKPNILDENKSKIAVWTLILMVVLVSLNILSMFKAAVLAVITLVLTKTIRLDEAKKYVHFHVLLLIASAIGIGLALEQTGAAGYIASNLVRLTQGLGAVGVLVVIYILTNVFTEMITNNAAAVLMFPIALAAANEMGIEPMAFFVTVTIAASASFITPIGYQTNLIVYGPGGYRFTDYVKVGLPLSFIFLFVTITVVSLVWL